MWEWCSEKVFRRSAEEVEDFVVCRNVVSWWSRLIAISRLSGVDTFNDYQALKEDVESEVVGGGMFENDGEYLLPELAREALESSHGFDKISISRIGSKEDIPVSELNFIEGIEEEVLVRNC